MSKIYLMSDALASQVAAGEVVERPASVLKELIENSIDAGASTITVDIRRGGIAMLRVSDDGSGMSPEDAPRALQRHATSKIRSLEELMTITQLGFRGEALPSIAAVSQFRLSTREQGALEGTELTIHGGELIDTRSSGVAAGTTIEIKELFFNIPARRKFLKSEETEAAQAEHQVRLHALAFPHIRFILRRDDRLIYDISPTQDWRVRIAQLSGEELAQKLIPVPCIQGHGLSVHGYILPISEARRTRKQQFIFLNNRPIEDPLIARAVRDGYNGFPTGFHPALYLNINIEPLLVDVNVHPSKREVRFSRPQDVVTTLIQAISQSLSNSVTPQKPPSTPRVAEPFALPQQQELLPPRPSMATSQNTPQVLRHADKDFSPLSLKKPLLPPILRAPQKELNQELPLTYTPPSAEPSIDYTSQKNTPTATGPTVGEFRLIGEFCKHYILWETPEGIVLMHMTAARERILFDQLTRQYEGQDIPTQQLLLPLVLELDVRDYNTFTQWEKHFKQAGFHLQSFGRNTLQMTACPAFLSLSNASQFCLNILDSLTSSSFTRKAKTLTFQLFAVEIALQAARQETPSLAEAPRILQALLNCELPYCTPQNKPTLVPFSLNEINRKFGVYA